MAARLSTGSLFVRAGRYAARSSTLIVLGLAAAVTCATGAAPAEADFEARLSKAKARFMEGARTEALATLSQLIQEQPTNSRAWFLRGLCYEAQREFPKA